MGCQSRHSLSHTENRLSYTGTFVLWAFALFWMVKFIQYVVDIQRLRELQNFYHYLLEIHDVLPQVNSLIVGRHPDHLLARRRPEIDETTQLESQYCGSRENRTKRTLLQTTNGCT
jgi:hypothetical protein